MMSEKLHDVISTHYACKSITMTPPHSNPLSISQVESGHHAIVVINTVIHDIESKFVQRKCGCLPHSLTKRRRHWGTDSVTVSTDEPIWTPHSSSSMGRSKHVICCCVICQTCRSDVKCCHPGLSWFLMDCFFEMNVQAQDGSVMASKHLGDGTHALLNYCSRYTGVDHGILLHFP